MLDIMPAHGSKVKLPTHIALRTDELAPLLILWKKRNRKGQWAMLLRRALKRELAVLATKRTQHLLGQEEGGPRVSRESERAAARLARLMHVRLRTHELAELLIHWKKRKPKRKWQMLFIRELKLVLPAVNGTSKCCPIIPRPAAGYRFCRETEMMNACLARLSHALQCEILSNPNGKAAQKFAMQCNAEWEKAEALMPPLKEVAS